jgi:hypothetical protein
MSYLFISRERESTIQFFKKKSFKRSYLKKSDGKRLKNVLLITHADSS